MPVINVMCLLGHRSEIYLHTWDDYGAATRVCACGHSLAPAFSPGTTLTWFEEGRGRWIENLGHEPVYITSHRQHREAMKKAGVTQGTPNHFRGLPGYNAT
jgi:hypothetical protein